MTVAARSPSFADLVVLVAAVAAVVWAAREFASLFLQTETPPRPRTGRRTSERGWDTMKPSRAVALFPR